MGARATFILLLTLSARLWAISPQGDSEGRNRLASTLMRLGQSVDLRVKQFPESSGGGKDFNANDGNAFPSDSAYHSYVWSYCEKWAGRNNCQKWVDPYVSIHGKDSDRSPEEEVVWKAYAGTQGQAPKGGGGGGYQYGIWNITTKNGGYLLDRDGKLDRRNIADWSVKPELKQNIAKLSDAIANRNIQNSLAADSANEKPEFTNMEALRMMAGRWTRMLRNRLVSNLGELRAYEKGIEFAMGEDKHTCDSYVGAMRKEMEDNQREGRIDQQARLSQEARFTELEKRYDLCQKMQSIPNSAVNPQVRNGKIQLGSPETEDADKWRLRVNIAAMDYAGIDPNTLPKPGDATIKKEEWTQTMNQYSEGSESAQQVAKTNAEQLRGYNENLREAAQGLKEVAARAPIKDYSDQIMANQIQVGERKLTSINSFTTEMRDELSGTSFPRTSDAAFASGPEEVLEMSPSELTMSAPR